VTWGLLTEKNETNKSPMF